jgi:hypothetical protein
LRRQRPARHHGQSCQRDDSNKHLVSPC